MKLVYKGKVKEIYEVSAQELEFLFTDNISVFDKPIPSKVPFKGETLCRTSAFWFEKCNGLGIKTHFLTLTAPNKMRVKRVRVRPPSQLTFGSTNYLIPLEFISRYYVSGSLFDRIKRGELSAKMLGFRSARPKYGEELPQPFLEVTTKLEHLDRKLSRAEALELAKLTPKEFEQIEAIILKLDAKISAEVSQRGLIHVDGKKEFAFDSQREIMLVDTFGTADEDRWWDAELYARGECVELSKEFVRKYYRDTGYYEKLMSAREHGHREPPIPPLPEDMLDATSSLYISMFERITGEKFRPIRVPQTPQ